jgi:predicted AAA+ superfamily ATPase
MIARKMEGFSLERAKKFTAIVILRPRQSGKTTLAQRVFSKHTYISLEELAGLVRFIITAHKQELCELIKNVSVNQKCG